MIRLIYLLSFLLIPTQLYAADGLSDGLLPATLKLVGGLGLVLGIVLLLYALSRKGFSFMPTPKSGIIKIVEMKHLMPKKSLCLIEIRGKELLLGLGVNSIELISPIEDYNCPSFEETLQSNIEEKK